MAAPDPRPASEPAAPASAARLAGAVAFARGLGGRLLSALPALFGVLALTFILMRVLPGDPASFFLSSPTAGEAELAIVRARMGLDQPLPLQFLYYLGDLATGDLGTAMTTGRPVVDDLAERLPASLELTFAGLILALIVAIPAGVLAAMRPGSVFDHTVRVVCSAGVSLPTFVSGLLLVYIFYYWLGWAPDPTGRMDIFAFPPPNVTGFLLIDCALAGDWETWGSVLSRLALPSITMALFVIAPLARITRGSMIAVLTSDFVRTADAVGLPRRKIIVTYALRNALIPVVTVSGTIFSTMLGANVLVEKVFSWPGVGRYALDALMSSDYAPVQGFVLLMASIFVLVNLIIDLTYALIDPRVSLA